GVHGGGVGRGEAMGARGNRHAREGEAGGTAEAETGFAPAYLVRHDDPRVDYAPPAPRALRLGERPPDPHLVQVGTGHRLDRLLALLAAEAVPGQLRVESAFDPRATDLRAVGR